MTLMSPEELIEAANGTNDQRDLVALAREQLSLVLNVSWKVETMRQKIVEAATALISGGDGSGRMDPDGAENSASLKADAAKGKADERAARKRWLNEKVTITIPRTEGDKRDYVFVGHNGVGIKIPKGKPVSIARKVMLTLKDALPERFDSKGESQGHTPAYPFQES